MITKNSVKLSSSTNLNALAAKAQRAAALAQAQHGSPKKKASKPKAPEPEIALSVRSIVKSIMSRLPENFIAVNSTAPLGAAYSIVSVYNADELKQWEKACELWKKGIASQTPPYPMKPKKPAPHTIYSFYPSVTDANKLGSVTIYGANAAVRGVVIQRTGAFCGFPIASVSIKAGLRPYADVKIRA